MKYLKNWRKFRQIELWSLRIYLEGELQKLRSFLKFLIRWDNFFLSKCRGAFISFERHPSKEKVCTLIFSLFSSSIDLTVGFRKKKIVPRQKRTLGKRNMKKKKNVLFELHCNLSPHFCNYYLFSYVYVFSLYVQWCRNDPGWNRVNWSAKSPRHQWFLIIPNDS